MPAVSKSQQQAAGAALAAKRGDISPNDLFGASKQMYDSMSASQLEDFAGTKHKGLPDVKEEKLREYIRKYIKEIIEETELNEDAMNEEVLRLLHPASTDDEIIRKINELINIVNDLQGIL